MLVYEPRSGYQAYSDELTIISLTPLSSCTDRAESKMYVPGKPIWKYLSLHHDPFSIKSSSNADQYNEGGVMVRGGSHHQNIEPRAARRTHHLMLERTSRTSVKQTVTRPSVLSRKQNLAASNPDQGRGASCFLQYGFVPMQFLL